MPSGTCSSSASTLSAPTALRTSSWICASSAAVRGVGAALLFGAGWRSATSTATVMRLIAPGAATKLSVVFEFS